MLMLEGCSRVAGAASMALWVSALLGLGKELLVYLAEQEEFSSGKKLATFMCCYFCSFYSE